jgi:hypothetical protein
VSSGELTRRNRPHIFTILHDAKTIIQSPRATSRGARIRRV